MKRKHLSLCIIVLSVLSIETKAQFNYKPGRIITNNNDTLFGYINDGGDIRNPRYCIFKDDRKSKPVKYYPNDIKSYLINDEKYYSAQNVTKNNKSLNRFIDVLLEGKVNLYNYPKFYDDSYYIQMEGGELIELIQKSITLRKESNSASSLVENTKYKINFYFYKDTLEYLFRENNLILNQIPNLVLSDEALQNITKTYIGLTCGEDNCVKFKKDLNKRSGTFGFFTGLQYSKISIIDSGLENEPGNDQANSMFWGAFYSTPIDLISDKFSFQLELTGSQFKYSPSIELTYNQIRKTEMNSTVVSIPIFIKYNFGLKNIENTIGFGKETGIVVNSNFQYLEFDSLVGPDLYYHEIDYPIYRLQQGGWFLDIGQSFQLKQGFSLFYNIRFQNRYSLIINDENTNHLNFSIAENNGGLVKYATEIGSIRFGISF